MMNELLKIETMEGQETVNARDLHKFLEVGKDFSTWFKDRVEKYGFESFNDFMTIESPNLGTGKSHTGGSPKKDYYLTIEMAKELSMVENNARGREARLYFIEVERKAREFMSGPGLLARAVLEAQKTLEAQTLQIQAMKPKADFYDAVSGSKDAVDLGLAAKTLNIPGIGRNNLFQILREEEILMHSNIPYQTYVDRGYFRVVESRYTKPDGSVHLNFKTLVYQKGLDFIRRIIVKQQPKPWDMAEAK